MIRNTDFIHSFSLYSEWTHAGRDHRASLDDSARTDDRRIAAVLNAELFGHFRRDFTEKLGLQFCKV